MTTFARPYTANDGSTRLMDVVEVPATWADPHEFLRVMLPTLSGFIEVVDGTPSGAVPQKDGSWALPAPPVTAQPPVAASAAAPEPAATV